MWFTSASHRASPNPSKTARTQLQLFEQARFKHTISVALRATARRALSQSRIVYLARPLSCWPDFVLHTQSCQFVTRKWLILHLIDQPGVIHDHQDVQLAKDVHLGLQLRRFPQHPG